MIEARTLSGFRDYLPAIMLPRERVLQTARQVYRSYGFTPIDTPAAEALPVLLGKGGDESDKLVYRIRGAKSETEEMGLRFDLTVPFARFAANHIHDLGTPFKRYAMGPVWRGERPGKGRYREFWQCDFDTIGTTSNAADIEVTLVICDLFHALGFEKFTLRINHRALLNGVLESLGIADHATAILRSLDKLDKIGTEKVIDEMTREANIAVEQAKSVLAFAATKGTNFEILDQVEASFAGTVPAKAALGLAQMRELLRTVATAGIDTDRILIDLSIARGLEYYTGTIYETILNDLPSIGSVCSGGRYDNLASLYTKQVLPGVGASLGVDRLLVAMEELQHPWMTGATSPATVLVLQMDANMLGPIQALARELRQAGIATEVYPDAKKLGNQFQYAEKRGHRLAIIAGPDDLARGVVQLKDLQARSQAEVPQAEIVRQVQTLLAGATP
ncbi:MAG: histidine--tRNA ligase [Gemmataceae bacterium]